MWDRDSIRAGISRALLVPLRGRLTRAARPWPLATLAGLLMAALIPGVTATAAAATTTSAATTPAAPPVPVTWCGGSLSLATPTIDDPNLLNYKFHCDGQVTAYTVVVNRPGHLNDEIDDFATTASVFDPATGDQLTTESFSCSGILPGSGINCYAGTGSSSTIWTNVEGQLDTSDPFCANLPKGAKPGTKPEPGAVAQLVVTDPTGAEQGPFGLPITPACKRVKAVPKAKPAKHRRVHKATLQNPKS